MRPRRVDVDRMRRHQRRAQVRYLGTIGGVRVIVDPRVEFDRWQPVLSAAQYPSCHFTLLADGTLLDHTPFLVEVSARGNRWLH